MKHRKYNSITNHYRTDFIDKIKEAEYSNLEYVVQEKVHGANFSFITDGTTIKCGKRTELLEDDTKFFNFQKIKEKHTQLVLNIFNDLKTKYDFNSMTVYGELCGGFYPHEDISNKRNEGAVQKGVHYSPELLFYAFDICLDNYLIDVNITNQVFEKHNIFYAKTLFTGTLDECLNFSIEFDSKIPEWLGLPKIPDNICEGVVIRSTKPLFIFNGDRVILKKKNAKFAEKKQQPKRSKQQQKIQLKLSDNCVQLKATLISYINVNRLNNVVSKIGNVYPKDFGNVLKEFNIDILCDFLLEKNKEFISLVTKEQRYLKKYMSIEAVKVVKAYLDEIKYS